MAARRIVGTPEKVHTAYCLEISPQHVLNIRRKDEKGKSLVEILEDDFGAFEVDYDAMSGPYVSYCLSVEDDTPEKHAAICEAIRVHA